jgi:molybdopterin molybdotransferase
MRQGLSVEQAQQAILEVTPVLAAETVAVRDALGRILTEAVRSARTLPPADVSAMDGYALRRADVAGASAKRPGELPVVYEVAAGAQPQRALGPGEAARIFTGAPVPPGADVVVRQEDTERAGDTVRILLDPKPREHIRAAGEDIVAGDVVLEAGDPIRSPQVGLLASLGRTIVSVHQRPRVAILSGGDELVEPDGDVTGGRIVSSNSYTLAAQCLEIGAEPVYLGIARDTPQDIEAHLRAGLRADVVVSSAGVSVGDRDYVRGVLEKLGCPLIFWGVHMKPGYPLAFGRFAEDGAGVPGPLVFGLPGNPVSAMVTFEQFVRPALRKMSGHRALYRPTIEATLAHDLRKGAGRLNFERVQLQRKGGEVVASSTGNQSSGVLRSMSLAQGLMIFPAEATILKAGERVTVQVIDESFFAGEVRGF